MVVNGRIDADGDVRWCALMASGRERAKARSSQSGQGQAQAAIHGGDNCPWSHMMGRRVTRSHPVIQVHFDCQLQSPSRGRNAASGRRSCLESRNGGMTRISNA